MKTTVVNIRRQEYDVYIGRAQGRGRDGYWGNPFSMTRDGGRAKVIELYRKYFLNRLQIDKEFAKRLEKLKGKRLGCFCAPELCHGNIIADYLDIEPGVKPYVDSLLTYGFLTFMSCDGGDGHDFKKRIIRMDTGVSNIDCFKAFEKLCNFVVSQRWTYCTPKLVWQFVVENSGPTPRPYFELVWN